MASDVKFGFSLNTAAFKAGIEECISRAKTLSAGIAGLGKGIKAGNIKPMVAAISAAVPAVRSVIKIVQTVRKELKAVHTSAMGVRVGLSAIGAGLRAANVSRTTKGLKIFLASVARLSARPFMAVAYGVEFLTSKAKILGHAFRRAWTLLGDGIQRIAMLKLAWDGIYGVVNSIVHAIGRMFHAVSDPAADMEKLALSFEVLLGSAEAAQAHMAELVTYASHTPFAMDDVARASRTLIAFGVPVQESVHVLKQLGDIAALAGQDLNELALIYGKVAAAGKMDTQVTNQLASKGIVVRTVMTEQLGWSNSEYTNKLTGGKLGKRELDMVLTQLTSEGGAFYRGAERLATTFSGLISTLSDNIQLALGDIGEGINENLKPVIGDILGIIDSMRPSLREFGQYIGGIIATFTVKFRETVTWINEHRYRLEALFDEFINGLKMEVGVLKDIAVWLMEVFIEYYKFMDSTFAGGYFKKRWDAAAAKDAAANAARPQQEAERRERARREEEERREQEAEMDRVRAAAAAAQAAEAEYEELANEFKKKSKEWHEEDEARRYTESSVRSKRGIVSTGMRQSGIYITEQTSTDDMLRAIDDRLLALANEGATDSARNEEIRVEGERLMLLRKQVVELQKQEKSLQASASARETEMEAMRLELDGKEEEARRLRADAEMYARAEALQREGYSASEAKEIAAEEAALKWVKAKQQVYGAADERAWKPNVIAQNMAQLGSGHKLMDLTQSFDIGKKQLQVQEDIKRAVIDFRATYEKLAKQPATLG